jgi:hypothetical protein
VADIMIEAVKVVVVFGVATSMAKNEIQEN